MVAARSRRSAGIAFLSAILVLAMVGADKSAVPVPADVREVATGGAWSSPHGSGTYRVIARAYGSEHSYTVLEAEWLSVGDARGSALVSHRAKIKELSDDPLFVIQDLRIVKSRDQTNGAVVEAVIADRYSGLTRTATIRLGDPGKYSVDLPESEE
jgi:hypothetical protein